MPTDAIVPDFSSGDPWGGLSQSDMELYVLGEQGVAAKTEAMEIADQANQGFVPAMHSSGVVMRDADGNIVYVDISSFDASWGIIETVQMVGEAGTAVLREVLVTTKEVAEDLSGAVVATSGAVAVSFGAVGAVLTAGIVGAIIWFFTRG